METGQGPGEPDREGFVSEEAQEGESPDVHTSAEQGHPAGDEERTDRDIGGPTSPSDEDSEEESGDSEAMPSSDPFEGGAA